LPTYDGVVTVAGDDIPVLVVFDGDSIRMSASGTEIGEWRADECQINHLGDTTYTITAEDETLQFVPNQPTLFAAAVNGGIGKVVAPGRPDRGHHVGPSDPERQVRPSDPVEAPPPTAVTMALFYGLCALTAGLAMWSLISMIIG